MRLQYLFLGLAGALTVLAVVLFFSGGGVITEKAHNASPASLKPVTPTDLEGEVSEAKPQISQKNADDENVAASDANSAELVKRVAAAIQSGNMPALTKLVGEKCLDDAGRNLCIALLSSMSRLKQPLEFREIGELELNKRSRWAIGLVGRDMNRNRIVLDLKQERALWSVEKIILPPIDGVQSLQNVAADSLDVADGFLQAVLRQQFELARVFVDPKTVNNAKIAGLCIIFEEGKYALRKLKPIRAMFQRSEVAGYLVAVVPADGSREAGFSITVKKSIDDGKWSVSEINLDQLLADYANRFAGGDLYYSPLVKNPEGGDTLALYFEFDKEEVNNRTMRQLEIVSKILCSDPSKKITLSGHTDALGTGAYNDKLSARRATVVRDLLIQAGVSGGQIVTVAKGSSQPRRPNVTESGVDDPEGRKVNRRTEIYLDF
jgi:outer membrane protein OmpA-like peptidoglycan-associated protein